MTDAENTMKVLCWKESQVIQIVRKSQEPPKHTLISYHAVRIEWDYFTLHKQIPHNFCPFDTNQNIGEGQH